MANGSKLTDENLRMWAIEQAISLHGRHGLSTDAMLTEARVLLGFVREIEQQERQAMMYKANVDAQAVAEEAYRASRRST